MTKHERESQVYLPLHFIRVYLWDGLPYFDALVFPAKSEERNFESEGQKCRTPDDLMRKRMMYVKAGLVWMGDSFMRSQ